MKWQGRKLHRVVNILSALILVTVALTSPALPVPATSAAAPTAIGERSSRTQLGLTGSGSIVVWEDRLVSSGPAAEIVRGSADILGFDFATNRSIAVATGPGDQTEPAISGSVVVWEDRGHSCPTCDPDIRAKDLATGRDYAVATGPTYQTSPAIEGRTVVWVEADGTRQRLLEMNIDDSATVEIVSVPFGTTINRPAISHDLIVWSEDRTGEGADDHLLRAYGRTSGLVTMVAETGWKGLAYAVSERRVVWTDPTLRMLDLNTGVSSVLDQGFSTTPDTAGDTVVYSRAAEGDVNGYDIYGLDLSAGTRKALVVATGTQVRPRILGDRLLWQVDEPTRNRILVTSLSQAFMAPVISPAAPGTSTGASVEQMPVVEGGDLASSADVQAATTRPTFKGVHLANGTQRVDGTPTGWYNYNGQPCIGSACPAIDALGAPNAPFFGSMVVLSSDLGVPTGRGAPWGPTVGAAMGGISAQYGTRVVVRTFPGLAPNHNGTVNTADVAQQVINLAQSYDWVRHVQINNEANQEWPADCSNGCKYTLNGVTKTYYWSNRNQPAFYQAINDFYSDAWWLLSWDQGNYPDPIVKGKLQLMQFWTPPMGDTFLLLSDGTNFYHWLTGMINLYGRLDYHTYPAPNWDTDQQGALNNTSYTKGFNAWLRGKVDTIAIRSMITEFGWNPGQMMRFPPGSNPKNCTTSPNTDPNMGQWQHPWPTDHQTHGDGVCKARDGQDHNFEGDIAGFLARHRRNAEVVAVWIVRGWNNPADPRFVGDPVGVERADGVDDWGNVRPWFQSYQVSNP